MSHEETNTSSYVQNSLSSAKKQRKQFEQDAILLSNRIKLLQLEEAKTWKHIKETQKKKALMEEFRKIKEEKIRQKEQIAQMFEKQREEQVQKNKLIKLEQEKSKYSSKKIIEDTRKNNYYEVKRLRNQFELEKIKNEEDALSQNKKRSTSVKAEHLRQYIRRKKDFQIKQNKSKEYYIKRVNHEAEVKQDIQEKVSQMEKMEIELIRRLQNTQLVQQKIIFDYEKLKKN